MPAPATPSHQTVVALEDLSHTDTPIPSPECPAGTALPFFPACPRSAPTAGSLCPLGLHPALGQHKEQRSRDKDVSPAGPPTPALPQPSAGDAYFLAQVFLSTRRGAWVFNRVGDQGYPVDVIFTTRMKMFLQNLLSPSMVNGFMEKQLNARFNHSHYGLKPKHRCWQTLPLPGRDPLPLPCAAPSVLSMLPGPRQGPQLWKPG